MAKKMFDPTKERQQIVPVGEREAPAAPEMPMAAEEAAPVPPAPEAPIAPEAEPMAEAETMISLNVSDIPEMSGKKPGDMVSLNIDAEITQVTDGMVELKLVSAKEVSAEKPETEEPAYAGPKASKIKKETTISALKPEEA